MKTRRRKRGRIIVYGGEILLLFLSFGAAYWLRFVSFEKFGQRLPAGVFLLMIVVYPAAFYLGGLYLRPGRPWSSELYWRLAFTIGPAAVALGFLKYAFFLQPIGRGLLFIANFLFFILAFVWRSLVGPWRGRGEDVEPSELILIGSDRERAALADAGRSAGVEYSIRGPEEMSGLSGGEAGRKPEKIIVGEIGPADKETSHRILLAQRGGAEIIGFSEMYQSVSGRIPIDFIAGEDWFWRTAGFQLSERETFVRVKRVVDFGLALVFVVATSVVWGLIAALIKATSKGKVFYRQTRVGKNGAIFQLVKFRSMIERAEESEPVWAEENDKRITGVGRILRKLHADELPQLLNVLKGEMSLVGPRPERPEFVEMLEREIPYYGLRHLVKPGLTGWAQINHPYAASLEDSKVKLEYDLYYIAHMSLGFDLRILLRTVQAPTP